MERSSILGIICLFIALPVFAKSPVDLMLEGRYVEARAILDSTRAEPRYATLLEAMTEPDAVRACSLYAVISQRYPHTDCDTLAQSRLQMAAAMGVPIARVEETLATPEVTTTAVVQPAPEPAPVAPPVVEASKTAPPAAPVIDVQPAVHIAPPEPAPMAKVEPKPEELTPHDKPSAHPGAWFVQVGAYGNHENARKLAAKLEQAGYGIAIVPKTINDKELLQVRVGGYPDRESCRAAADELKAKYNLNVALVIQ